MKILYRFGEELFWTAFWVFLVLVIGFAVLNALSNRFSGNFVGSGASWVASHASDQAYM